MSAVPAPQGDLLNRILALTPAGQRELRDPRAGLSLPQRWLLVQVDGESSLADIAERTAGTAQVDRLPRDAAKLVSLGMAYDVGEPGPSEFGPSTQQGDFAATVMSPPISAAMGLPPGGYGASRSRLPMLAIGGALALAGVGAGYLLWSPSSPAPPAAAPASPTAPSTGAAAVSPVQEAAASVAATLAAPLPARAETPALPPPLPTSPGAVGPGAQPLPVATAPLQGGVAAPAVVAPLPARAASGSRLAGNNPVAPLPYGSPAQPPARRSDEPALRVGTEPPAAAIVAPTATPAPTPAPPPAPAPASTAPAPPPVAVAPSPPPPAQSVSTAPAPVAYSAPAPSPAPASLAAAAAPLRPVSNPAPTFPREAVADSRREVLLKARLVVGPTGEVTRVEFTDSSPRDRAFERSARTTLLQWRFPEGSGERSYRTDLVFKLD